MAEWDVRYTGSGRSFVVRPGTEGPGLRCVPERASSPGRFPGGSGGGDGVNRHPPPVLHGRMLRMRARGMVTLQARRST